MPFAHEVSWPSRPRRFFSLSVMRRVFSPLLALLFLVPGVLGFIPGEAIIRRVMTQELERQTEALVRIVNLLGFGLRRGSPWPPRRYAAKPSKGNKEISDQTAKAAVIFSRYMLAARR